MFSFLLGFRAKLAALGAVLMSILYLVVRLKVVKAGKEKAEEKANILGARNHTLKERAKIEREKGFKEVSRKADLINEMKKPKEEREYKNFTKPNDYY